MSVPFEMHGSWGGHGPADFLRMAMGARRHHFEPPGGGPHGPGFHVPPEPPEPPDGPEEARAFKERAWGRGFGPGAGAFLFGPGGPFGDPRQWTVWEPRTQRARKGDVRAAVLALLNEQPMNGYQIIQEIKQRSGGLWQPSSGSVYPALQQLEDEGLVQAGEHEGRRAFTLTEAGRTYVREHPEEMAAPWVAAFESAPEPDPLAMRETFGKMFAAFVQVCRVGTDEQRERAARTIEEARKSLYRILAEDDG
jgi:DNA-binding PadR family transcriptional regulator